MRAVRDGQRERAPARRRALVSCLCGSRGRQVPRTTQREDTLIEAHYLCWNGPCEGQLVTECPLDATVGTACAIPWKTTTGHDRYAIYVLLEKPDGQKGLVYEKSYTSKSSAVHRVTFLAYAVRQHHGIEATN